MASTGSAPGANTGRWFNRLRGPANGLFELAMHAAGAGCILAFIRFIEKTMQFFWGTEEIVFFEHLKVKYIFQGADLFLLLGFLVLGTYRFLKAFYS